MLVSLKIKIFTVMEHLLGQMEINILVNTKTINKTVKARIPMRMAALMLVRLRMMFRAGVAPKPGGRGRHFPATYMLGTSGMVNSMARAAIPFPMAPNTSDHLKTM